MSRERSAARFPFPKRARGDLLPTSESMHMAARPVGVWGIDLGQCALKAIRLEMKDGQVDRHRVRIHRASENPQPAGRRSRRADARGAQTIPVAQQDQGGHGRHQRAGPKRIGALRQAAPVDEKKIADIVKFEAKQQIPFPLEEVVWDFQNGSTRGTSLTAWPWRPRSACSP